MTDRFELLQLGVGALTPISVALIGWMVSRLIKRLEQKQWATQQLTMRRLEIFDEIAPKLNKVLCFSILVGEWRSISPNEAIRLKREIDARIHGSRFLVGNGVFDAYRAFINSIFERDNNPDSITRFRSVFDDDRLIINQNDRFKDQLILISELRSNRADIKILYLKLSQALSDSFQLKDEIKTSEDSGELCFPFRSQPPPATSAPLPSA